jgi:hypothetical protein
MRKDRLLRKTLDLVNEARYELGKELLRRLPMGVPGKPAACPLACALGEWATVLEDRVLTPANLTGTLLSAWQTRAVFDKYLRSPAVILPAALRQFVTLFDRGEIPELVAHDPDTHSRVTAVTVTRKSLTARPGPNGWVPAGLLEWRHVGRNHLIWRCRLCGAAADRHLNEHVSERVVHGHAEAARQCMERWSLTRRRAPSPGPDPSGR